MRIKDALKFSLELFLPERLLQAIQHRLVSREELLRPSPSADSSTAGVGTSQFIIESLDHDAFGGPSFGPHTVALMSRALDEIRAELVDPVSDDKLRCIATAILKAAADGERDVARLKAKARIEPHSGDTA